MKVDYAKTFSPDEPVAHHWSAAAEIWFDFWIWVVTVVIFSVVLIAGGVPWLSLLFVAFSLLSGRTFILRYARALAWKRRYPRAVGNYLFTRLRGSEPLSVAALVANGPAGTAAAIDLLEREGLLTVHDGRCQLISGMLYHFTRALGQPNYTEHA